MSFLTHNGDTNFKIQHLDKTFDSSNIDDSALSLIFALYPEWEDKDGPVEITRFTDGITNTVCRLCNPIISRLIIRVAPQS